MDIVVFEPGELETVMRVLRTALGPDGVLDAPARSFLQTYARISGYLGVIDALAPLPAEDAWIEFAHPRKRLLQLAALAVLLRNPLRADAVDYLQAVARQLQVHDPVLRVIDALHRGQRLRVRALAMLRAFGALLGEAYAAEGTMGIVRFFGALFLRRSVNRNKHWDYKRLGLLPEGTLGREYWKHLTALGFGFPGEPGGIAESVAYHDIGHVLTGYGTDPAGEIQQGSFQAGNRREDGFFFVQFVVLQFHHGVQITPVAPPQSGLFDPANVLWAIHRGAQACVDITHQWNYWPWMSLPLDEARERFGLLPALS